MKIVQPVVEEFKKIMYIQVGCNKLQYDDIKKQISAGRTQGGRKGVSELQREKVSLMS